MNAAGLSRLNAVIMEINTSLITVGTDGTAKKNKPAYEQQSSSEKQAVPARPNLIKAPQNAEDLEQAGEYQRFIREASDNHSQKAISTYTSLEKQTQREHVQTLFGVDTYA